MTDDQLPYVTALNPLQRERIRQLVAAERLLEDSWRDYAQEFGWGAGGGDPVEVAKKSVRDRLHELQGLLCQDAGIGKVAASPMTGATIAVASVFTGRLVSANFGGVDVVQLGVLLAQIGLLAICRGDI